MFAILKFKNHIDAAAYFPGRIDDSARVETVYATDEYCEIKASSKNVWLMSELLIDYFLHSGMHVCITDIPAKILQKSKPKLLKFLTLPISASDIAIIENFEVDDDDFSDEVSFCLDLFSVVSPTLRWEMQKIAVIETGDVSVDRWLEDHHNLLLLLQELATRAFIVLRAKARKYPSYNKALR